MGWKPSNVIDVFEVCLDKGWARRDIKDQISANIVDGPFCRRGWRFCGDQVPSPIVLQHREIYVYDLLVWPERIEASCTAPAKTERPLFAYDGGLSQQLGIVALEEGEYC